MSVVTCITFVETTSAIWEFDPSLPRNRILDDSLDVVSAIQMITIKIQASGQCITYFECLQTECGFTVPLSIPLHSNVCWGTADGMLGCAYHLRQPINLFINSSDKLFGPITTIQRSGLPAKQIPWTTFAFKAADWEHVVTSAQSWWMQIIFSNTSCSSFNPLSGVQSLHSRNFKWAGRPSVTHQDMCFTRMQSIAASQKSTSITISLMRSLLMSLLLVCLFYLHKLTSTYSLSTSPTPILQTRIYQDGMGLCVIWIARAVCIPQVGTIFQQILGVFFALVSSANFLHVHSTKHVGCMTTAGCGGLVVVVVVTGGYGWWVHRHHRWGGTGGRP